MDRNLLLAFALSFLVLSLWSMLQAPPPKPEGPIEQLPPGGQVAGTEVTERGSGGPGGVQPGTSRYPASVAPARPAGEPRAVRPAEAAADPGETIEISTPLYLAELSSRGAALRRWTLREYHDPHGDPIELARPDDREPSAATPFAELGRGNLAGEIWQVERLGEHEVAFALEREGVRVRKTYRFSPDSYHFRLGLEVTNGGDAPVAPEFVAEWPVQERAGNDFREQGAAALVNGELESTPLASLGGGGFFGFLGGGRRGEAEEFAGEIDWAGLQSPYFLAALFPDQPRDARARFYPVEVAKLGVVQVYFDPVELRPGQAASREYRVYAGPKQVERLQAFAPSAVESVDLGWSFIAPMTRAFTWLLAVLYSFIPNYGWAIIVLTLLVRVATAPLSIKQMKSMERMRRIQPKVKEIQEKYADDRQKQSEAMMSLYKQEKVNPLGGCLPMLLQLPVFIGLFYALRSSIQLRQAPWIAWIDDLSAPDKLFDLPGLDFPVRVLPLLMGASMFVQQKITPMQADPAQARMMLTIMPIMMTVISYTFPSGLVLYWMMSNVLAISHQLWIGRNLSPAGT